MAADAQTEVMTTSDSSKSGFTMLEIITVLIIIVVLVGLMYHPRRYPSAATRRIHCRDNLKQIANAKQQWAVEHKQSPTAVPVFSDICATNLYIHELLLCPVGGTYSLNAVSANPTCSKSGAPDFHTL